MSQTKAQLIDAVDGSIVTADIADQAITLDKLLHGTGSTDGKFLRANNGADPTFESVITDLVNDTSPQLGGDLASNGNDIDFADGDKAIFGTGEDLEIYHSNNESFIDDKGSGNLFIRSNGAGIHLKKHGTTETLATFNTDGNCELYNDNTKRFETGSLGVRFFGNLYADDNEKINLGTGQDLQIYHDGTDSRIHNGTGSLVFRTPTNYIFYNSDASEKHAQFIQNGAVELYHNNSKRLETTSTGVNFGGNLSSDSGANFTINGGGASGSAGSVLLRCASENAVVCNANGSVDLYHDNSKKAETFGSGFKVAGGGELYIDGNAASGHCQIIMTRSDRTWGVSNETNFRLYAEGGNSSNPFAGSQLLDIDGNGHILPGSNNSQDLGSSSTRWRNIYTNDLNLSNEGSSNDVDGTWGSYTIQEGAEDLFLVNKRSGKKYKFNLTEVS
jgi:hypothetical protein